MQVLRKGRKLSDFSPQQLAAIAWSFATVGIEAPRLFEAVQVCLSQPSLHDHVKESRNSDKSF
jgi:hypothetical protein